MRPDVAYITICHKTVARQASFKIPNCTLTLVKKAKFLKIGHRINEEIKIRTEAFLSPNQQGTTRERARAVIAPKQVSDVCRVVRVVQAAVGGGRGGGDHDDTLAKRKRREGHLEHAEDRRTAVDFRYKATLTACPCECGLLRYTAFIKFCLNWPLNGLVAVWHC